MATEILLGPLHFPAPNRRCDRSARRSCGALEWTQFRPSRSVRSVDTAVRNPELPCAAGRAVRQDLQHLCITLRICALTSRPSSYDHQPSRIDLRRAVDSAPKPAIRHRLCRRSHNGSTERCIRRDVIDLHIAAHARSEDLTLVTNNLGEFGRVPGLLLDNWVSALP